MSDVTCKAVQTFLDVAQERGVDPVLLTEGLGYSPEFLSDKNNRIKWADFVTIGNRVRELCHLQDADLEEVGRGVFKSGGLRFVMSLARVFGDPARFYKWMQRGNNMLFANMKSQVDIVDKQRLSIRIRLRDDDLPSREYLLISKGGIASMPTLLGYPEANVELTIAGPEAVFDVTMRPKRRSMIRRVIQAMGGISETAEELLGTNEALTKRLTELSEANGHIQKQAAQLDEQAGRLQLAHDVSKMIHGKFDVQATLDRIVEALATHTQATAVELRLNDGSAQASLRPGEGGSDKPNDKASDKTSDGGDGDARVGRGSGELAAVQPFDIEIRGQAVATLAMAAPAETGLATTLEYVLPVVAMALDNALAFRELAEYQRGLEKLVDERTADLRSARDDLSATVVQLKEVQGSRDVFFANISHEIRTPLSLIMLAAGDIEMNSTLDERARHNLSSVVSGARKLLRLVDELLLLAAGEQTKLSLRREPMDLGQMVTALVETWRPAAEAAGLTLRRTGAAQAMIVADATALDRVITNLVSNAVKFTPRGGSVTIDVSETAARASDGEAGGERRVAVSVRDTGIGIDEELAKRLFGRFERSQRATGKSGSGIGLSLVKELTEAHGGTVEVLRPEGGGAELRVELPRGGKDGAAIASPAVKPEGSAAAPDAPWSARRRLEPIDFGVSQARVSDGQIHRPEGTSLGVILVAEDDPGLSAMVVQLLSDEYTVIAAGDGLSALEMAKLHQPHLLVTDVQMPGMDGIELAQRFRGATNDRLAPVVIMSAIGDLGTRVKGLEAGAVDYVVKPFDPRELRARVRAQFRMRDLAVRLHQAEQLSALGTLSAGLAHELRNPANGIINAIRPLTKLLPAELSSKQSPVGQLLDVASGCADQIAFLSRQLLNFRSNGELELRKTTVAEMVKRAMTMTQSSLTGVEVRLSLDYDGEVRCAPQLMLQVLTNLIDNAAQAANPNGTTEGGWIEVVSHTDGTTVSLEVSDSGGGVPVDLRERVFEPFFTTKPPGVGTGLGLPLARDIVHRHGGQLVIRDRGPQCVFAIDLPIRQ